MTGSIVALVIAIGIPVGILFVLATLSGKSRWIALAGLLSYFGLIGGIIALLAIPSETEDEPVDIPGRNERFCRNCGAVIHLDSQCRTCLANWTPSGREPLEVLADAANLLLSLAPMAPGRNRPGIIAGLARELTDIRKPVNWPAPAPATATQVTVAPTPVAATTPAAAPLPRPAVPLAPAPAAAPAFRSTAAEPLEPVVRPAHEPAVVAAPPPPSRPPGESVRTWAARRQADLLLYLGAFMLSIAALTFVNYQGDALTDAARVTLLGTYTFGFLVLGFAVRRWDRVREAGPVFVGLGAILSPLWFLLLYVQVLEEREVSRSLSLLIGSSLTCGLYSLLVRQQYGRLYAIPAVAAGLLAWGALGSTLGLPWTWQGAWFTAASAVALVGGRERYASMPGRLVYAGGALVGGVSIIFAAGVALASVQDGEVQLPVSLVIATVAAAWLATRHRLDYAFGLLPPLVVAAAWTAAWAVEWQGPGKVEWWGVTTTLIVFGYAVLRETRRAEDMAWQAAEYVTAALALVFAHAALSSGDQHVSQLSITFVLVALAAAWEFGRRQDTVAIVALPFLVMGAFFAALDAFDVRPENWAWPAVGLAVVLLGTEHLWGRFTVAARAYPPVALLFSLFPVLLIPELRSTGFEQHSAAGLGIAGVTWLASSVRALRSWTWLDALTQKDPVAKQYLPGIIAAVGASLLYTALWLGLEGADVALNNTILALASTAAASWFVGAAVTRRWPSFDLAFVVPGGLVLAITVFQLTPSFDRLAVVMGSAVIAASLAVTKPQSVWRVAGGAVSMLAGWAVLGALVEEKNLWLATLATALTTAGFAWDGLWNRNRATLAAMPGLVVATLTLAVHAGGAEDVYLALPAVGVALLLAGSRNAWSRGRSWRTFGWANALVLSLAPVIFLGLYEDHYLLGAAAFAGSALTWVLAGYWERSPITPVRPPLVESATWSVALLLSIVAGVFTGEHLAWQDREYSIFFSAVNAAGWLWIAASKRQAWRVLVPGVLAGTVGTFLAMAAATEDAQRSAIVAVTAAGSLATVYSLRSWWPTLVSTAFGALSIALSLEALEAAQWWPGVVFTAIAAGSAFGLMRWRTYQPTQSAVFSLIIPLAWYGLGLFAALATVADRSATLGPDGYLPQTQEWAAAALVLLAGGVAVSLEGLRLKLGWVTISGAILAAGAIEMGIAMADPITIQAYTTPAGLALVVAGVLMKRSDQLFGRHMTVHEGLMTLGVLLVVLPGAGDALNRPDIGWSLLLIAEGIAFLAAGLVLAQRWLVVGGVLTLVGVAVRFYTSGTTQPPYWVTLGLVGTSLLALGVLLLSARDWWDRRKDQLVHWWLGDDPGSMDSGGAVGA